MKAKEFYLLVFICCCLCLCSCDSVGKTEYPSNNEEPTYLLGIPISDSMNLSSVLTESYPLQELVEYYWLDLGKFWDNLNDPDVIESFQNNNKTIAEAKERFPIALLRTSGYTVYKVAEGGYFYVFFIDRDGQDVTSDSDPDRIESATCYYIPEKNLFSRYFKIKKGDTIGQVKQLDPLLSVDHVSATRRSYLYLTADKVLILYLQNNGTDEDGYEIIEKRIVDRKDTMTRLALILDKDLDW